MAPTSIMFYKDVGHSQEGAKEVTSLLEAGAFDGPKPVRLLLQKLQQDLSIVKQKKEMENIKYDNLKYDTEKTDYFFELFRSYKDISTIDRTVLVDLIDKILVENSGQRCRYNSRPKKITVFLNFTDEIKMLQEFIEEYKQKSDCAQ